MAAHNKFNVKVHYPTPENKDEFDKRAAKAVAKVLYEVLPYEKIDELIEAYNKSLNDGSQKDHITYENQA